MTKKEYEKIKGIQNITPQEIETNLPNDKKIDKLTEKCNDPVVEAVRQDLLNRSHVGIVKYGTTLYDNMGDLRYWLQHSYEETLDKANYLKRAIMEIDRISDDNK